jgi:hypothetical protein
MIARLIAALERIAAALEAIAADADARRVEAADRSDPAGDQHFERRVLDRVLRRPAMPARNGEDPQGHVQRPGLPAGYGMHLRTRGAGQ